MAFGKTRKYKKVVKVIFPSQPGGEFQLSNISKLVYFCEMNPEQLQKVGPYIQQKAEKNLSRKRIDFVKACVIIIRELISQCRKNLVLFATNATKLMELLLQQEQYPDLQIEATETVQDDASLFPEVESFIKYFIKMSHNTTGDEIARRKIRGEGLRGISAYISILDLVDELDTFISTHREIISTILDNMQYRDQVPTPSLARRNTQSENDDVNSALPSNVKAIATECLRDLARRVDNITVNTMVQTILNYLDSQQLWIDNVQQDHCFPRESVESARSDTGECKPQATTCRPRRTTQAGVVGCRVGRCRQSQPPHLARQDGNNGRDYEQDKRGTTRARRLQRYPSQSRAVHPPGFADAHRHHPTLATERPRTETVGSIGAFLARAQNTRAIDTPNHSASQQIV
ncbi:hypothetical protein PPL_04608 [Heterostelium album PN500]|uniref:Uncharacterized protein n=1 Tax=Heterostelium pallidum (strain ATCC 26659 / Pp 5 / PN500) TaxID=670386 RepID=D3B818_HETP5|nr:hypothetical protein PPL_04608 [Heterostelium album PN500]EFA82186.1 hypothetical protein PPL_04608 [Heterostelium album PN500]|eukprot:XP_020434303.1 hypothetical protein PPL_04608 [Heterostelium album PN500]